MTTTSLQRQKQALLRTFPLKLPVLFLVISFGLLSGCSSQPPKSTHKNVCKLFDYDDIWYDAAAKSEKKWGVPKYILLAFVHQESRFKEDAQPKRDYFLGFIPLPRRSSAYGYSQAQDPAWADYMKHTGRLFASRSNVNDTMDFIGWYNYMSHKKLGISRKDAYRLYLAYHEGRGGYARKTYLKKPWLIKVAKKVARQAETYKKQLWRCESNFKCTAPWPFCR